MATVVNTNISKICHAKVGQFVRLPNAETGAVQAEVFVVVAVEDPRRKPARPGMSQGLYDEGRELLLVSLDSGMARPIPHLSSRAELLSAKDYVEVLGRDVPVLTPALEVAAATPAWALVQYVTKHGKKQTVEVNLADTEDVGGFLELLQDTEGRVVYVKEERSLEPEEQLWAQWRRAVSQGLTRLSFEDYKREQS